MHKTLLAAIAVAALHHTGLTAQEHLHQHRHFDRHTAIEHALEFNKDLVAARVSVQRAEARLDASGIAPNPSLQIQYEDDLLFHDEGESSFGLGITQAFPLAGRLSKQKALTRFDIDLARLEVRSKELQLIAEISQFALEIHLADTRSSHLQALRDALAKTVDFATAKSKTGEISSLEAQQFQLELRILEQDLKNLALTRERLIHRLAPLLGQAPTEHFEFDASNALPYADGPIPDYHPEVLERIPSYQLALLRQQAAQAKIALARTENWDDLTASLFWKNEKGNDFPRGRTSDQLLGVSVSIPLPLRKKGDLAAQEPLAALDQSRLQAAATRFQIQNEIEHARHEAVITSERMQDYQKQVLVFAAQQLELHQQAYQNGQIDMLTLLRSQQQRLSLENGYLDLYTEYAHALIELENARADHH